MIAGMDRYSRSCRCSATRTCRADRQPEFADRREIVRQRGSSTQHRGGRDCAMFARRRGGGRRFRVSCDESMLNTGPTSPTRPGCRLPIFVGALPVCPSDRSQSAPFAASS
jgi:hypothetical protein